MFNRQIHVILRDLAPILRRYDTTVLSLWGLHTIGYTDLQITLHPLYAPTLTLTQAKTHIKNATALLGQDYQAQNMQAFSERWIDFPANQGKDSGAYTAGPYGDTPYVTNTWSNTLPAVYTYIHETPTTAQMVRSQTATNVLDADFNAYLVTSPSTFNTLLHTHYLTTNAKDPHLLRFALSRLLKHTYFHNFVTTLLTAAFQRTVYNYIDNGTTLHAARLDALTRKVHTDFWGSAVTLQPGAQHTWMRQSTY